MKRTILLIIALIFIFTIQNVLSLNTCELFNQDCTVSNYFFSANLTENITQTDSGQSFINTDVGCTHDQNDSTGGQIKCNGSSDIDPPELAIFNTTADIVYQFVINVTNISGTGNLALEMGPRDGDAFSQFRTDNNPNQGFFQMFNGSAWMPLVSIIENKLYIVRWGINQSNSDLSYIEFFHENATSIQTFEIDSLNGDCIVGGCGGWGGRYFGSISNGPTYVLEIKAWDWIVHDWEGPQTIIPSAPVTPTLLTPFNTTVHRLNQTLTWLNQSDADNFTVYHTFNNSIPNSIICDQTTSLTCLGNATSGEGNYFWLVQANNDIGSTNSSTRFWEYDITTVLIQFTFPSQFNTTITNLNILMNVTFQNINLDSIFLNVSDPNSIEVYKNDTQNLSQSDFNILTVVPVASSGTYTIFAFGNDSAGLETQQTVTFFADVTPPAFNGFVNDYVAENTDVTFDINITDNFNLSVYTFGWNDTGVFVNDTPVSINGTLQPASILKPITASNNTDICGIFYATDQLTNVNQTIPSCFTFITPTIQPPTFFNLANDYVNESQAVTVNVSVNATLNLSTYIFSWNDTGIFVNDSAVSISGFPFANLTTLKTITASNNTDICALYFVNDTENTVTQSGNSCFTFIAPTVQTQFGFLVIVPLAIVLALFLWIIRVVMKLGVK